MTTLAEVPVVAPERTALLLLDLHRSTIERFAEFDPALKDTARRAIDAAHAAGVQVIFVVGRFRPGYPEISPRNEQLSRLLAEGYIAKAQEGNEVHPDLGPADGDLVVEKKRVGAFMGSDLDLLLRARGIERLVVGGIATSGVVLSTFRQAVDHDYRLVVLRDCCTDPDPEVHRVLLDKVFAANAPIVTTDEWVASLPG
jgi:nicotinamidase-related amidase